MNVMVISITRKPQRGRTKIMFSHHTGMQLLKTTYVNSFLTAAVSAKHVVFCKMALAVQVHPT